MAASQGDAQRRPSGLVVESGHTQLNLPPWAMRVRRNGIEFRSPTPFSVWTEMTVTLVSPQDREAIHGEGVVVACDGDRHRGYAVALLFLNLAAPMQERLRALAQTPTLF